MALTLQRRLLRASDGAQLAAYVHEPLTATDQTPTIVLAHGWCLSYRSWLPVIRRLATRGDTRVIAWDQRGHGASTLAGGSMRPSGESLPRLGDDLAAVVDQLVPARSRVTLGGHSMGGMTVLAFAGRHPDLLARVDRVLLASTAMGGLGDPDSRLALQATRIASRMRGRPGRLVTARSQRRTSFGEHPRPEDVRATATIIGRTRVSTIGTFYAAMMAYDEEASAPLLAGRPVTVVVGSRDRLTPRRFARLLGNAIPGASLTVLDGVGHMTPYEAVDTLVSELRPEPA